MKTTIAAPPAFSDNYIRCLRRGSDVAVYPDLAAPKLDPLQSERLTLTAIVITDHHAGAVGDNLRPPAKYSVPVFGPADGPVPGIAPALQVVDISGHTRGPAEYVGSGVLFCGALDSCG